MSKSVIRLYVDAALGKEQSVDLSGDQAHYLHNVLRQEIGNQIAIFNGKDGEWSAKISQLRKRHGYLTCIEQTKPQMDPPDLWMLFAPIKKARTDFIVEKATEMGAARIIPVLTDFTNSERIRQDRLQAHAIEAAQQCGGTFVPPVEKLELLQSLLQNWPEDRHILFCDEETAGQAISLMDVQAPWAILIGPEGGFSEAERKRLNAMSNAHSTSLGPRILRADTAAVAALTLWQSRYGDWQ